MQKIKFRHLQYLLRNKVAVVLCTSLLISVSMHAQFRDGLNLPNHDNVNYYFGIALGYNTSHYNITQHPYFLDRDTVQSVESQNSGRVHLGIYATWQASTHLDIRFYPLYLIFSEKKFLYTLKYPEPGDANLTQTQKVESIVMSFPLQVKLKSDRIGNFRVYSLAGIKYDYDLASNAGAMNGQNMVKVNKSDFGFELGIGFQFFTRMVILSPEIKMSYGLMNVHSRDESLKYSNVIDQMHSRMVMLTLHSEGGGLGF